MNQKGKSTIQAKGITLVSLAITIIILLILAAVGIGAINNGTIGKAEKAVSEHDKSEMRETIISTIHDLETETIYTRTEVDKKMIADKLIEKGIITDSSKIAKNGDVTAIIKGNEVLIEEAIDKSYLQIILPSGWDATKVGDIVTETSEVAGVIKERTAPIPVGYTVSEITTGESPENTIAGGLVIYDIPEGAQVDWNANIITIGEATTNLQETVNQYVWIPVDDINQMVMCKSNTNSSQCNLQLIDGILQCTNSSHSSNKTNLCGRLYGVDANTNDTTKPYTYTTNMNFADRSQTWSTSDFREPDIVSTYDKDDATSGKTYMATAGVEDGTVATFSSQLMSDFTKMATSVAKYGGFYVGRYEAGTNGESKKNQLVLTAAISATESDNYLAGNMWYGLYNTLRNTTIVDKSIVSTHMIWRKSVRPNDKFHRKPSTDGTHYNYNEITTKNGL